MTVYREIIIGFWAIFIVYWFISALSAKKNIRWNWRGVVIRLAAIVIIIALLDNRLFATLLHKYHSIVPPNPIIGVIGVILCGLGIALAIWARVYLGRNWGMPMSVKENPELVTSGPYNYVRHPIYSGILLAVLGSVFVSGWVWLVPFVFFFLYFIYSGATEEKVIAKQFPEQYPEYKKRTNMLIPYIL